MFITITAVFNPATGVFTVTSNDTFIWNPGDGCDTLVNLDIAARSTAVQVMEVRMQSS